MRLRFAVSLAILAFAALIVSAADTPKPKDQAGQDAKTQIVGKWQPTEKGGEKVILEFTQDGKIKVSAEGMNFEGTYKFLKTDQIEVKISIAGMDMTTKVTVKVMKDELTTTEEGKEKGDTFKRIK